MSNPSLDNTDQCHKRVSVQWSSSTHKYGQLGYQFGSLMLSVLR